MDQPFGPSGADAIRRCRVGVFEHRSRHTLGIGILGRRWDPHPKPERPSRSDSPDGPPDGPLQGDAIHLPRACPREPIPEAQATTCVAKVPPAPPPVFTCPPQEARLPMAMKRAAANEMRRLHNRRLRETHPHHLMDIAMSRHLLLRGRREQDGQPSKGSNYLFDHAKHKRLDPT